MLLLRSLKSDDKGKLWIVVAFLLLHLTFITYSMCALLTTYCVQLLLVAYVKEA